jgi:hypothetical protein
LQGGRWHLPNEVCGTKKLNSVGQCNLSGNSYLNYLEVLIGGADEGMEMGVST